MQDYQAELYKQITESFHYKYDAEKVLGWLVDDCLGSFGIPIPETPPEDVIEHLFTLSATFARAVRANPFQDVLGGLYQEIASKWKSKGLGQYFTPFPVARMMAMINDPVKMLQEARDRGHVMKVYEPAAGTGVMLLAMIEVIMEQEPDNALDLISYMSMTAIDIDYLCVRMTALQMLSNALFHNASVGELIVYRGNSLGDPKNWKRFCYANHRRWEQCGVPHAPYSPEKKTITVPDGQQFKLF